MSAPSRSRLWRPRGAVLALVALSLLAGLALPARGQRHDPKEEALRAKLREGTHAFRRILFDYEFKALKEFDELKERPDETILIVLGDLHCLRMVPGGLLKFIREGGAALIASDRGIGVDEPNQDVVEQIRAMAGVVIANRTMVCLNGDLSTRYQGLEYCPMLWPAQGVVPDLFRHPKNEKARLRVATNLPSWLHVPPPPFGERQRLPPGVAGLADLPPGCTFDIPGNVRPGAPRTLFGPILFAVGGNRDKGRILVLADHSIFINQMMLPTDNDNVEFTYNCLNYLRGDNEKRTRVLFVEDGTPNPNFEVPLKSLKIPPGEVLKLLFARRNDLLVEANNALVRAEERDVHNELLLDKLANMGLYGDRLTRFLLLVLTLVLLLYALYRVGARARHRQDLAVPVLSQAVASNLPAATLPEQRHQALLRARNLWGSAQAVVRQWFAKTGVPSGDRPQVVVDGNWWVRWRVRRLIGRLWALAYGPPVRVSPSAYKRLLIDLEDLDECLEDGSIRLRGPAA